MKSRRGILILGGDADGNLGDCAILAAMCAAIGSVDPQADVTVVSRHPAAMRQRLGVHAIRKGLLGLPSLCGAASRSRLVLVGGGGLFQDDDSLIKMPYWAARCLLVRLLCPRLAGCSLGVGPLRSRTSRWSARAALALMHKVSVRDALAQATARPLSPKPVDIVPDPAFMLDPFDDDAAVACLFRHGVPLDDGPLIGVTVRRWFPPRPRWLPNMITARFRDPAEQDAQSQPLVALWARVLGQVIHRTRGRVVMMPTYNAAHEGDDRLCRQVMAAIGSDRTHFVHIEQPALYKAVARRLAIMVSGRMHPTIFAASVGTPVVGVAYNPKFAGVFEMLGVPDRVVSVEHLVTTQDDEALVRLILAAMAEPAPLRERAQALAQRTRQWLAEVMR